MSLASIISGWANVAFETKEAEALATERAKKCSKCKHSRQATYLDWLGDSIQEIEGRVCGICHCPLSAKTRSTKEKCPVNKW